MVVAVSLQKVDTKQWLRYSPTDLKCCTVLVGPKAECVILHCNQFHNVCHVFVWFSADVQCNVPQASGTRCKRHSYRPTESRAGRCWRGMIKFTTDYDHVTPDPQTFKVNGLKVKVIA